jgi:bifunctional DNase/RNase
MQSVEVHIIALIENEQQDEQFVIVMEEQGGFRRLSVLIGAFEAQAIALAIQGRSLDRPATHDLFKDTILASGMDLQKIIINELKEEVFHAQLILKKVDGHTIEIDARTSDALALAVRFGCPIFVTEPVLAEAGFVSDKLSKKQLSSQKALSEYSVQELEHLLKEALAREDYELASNIRDIMAEK